MSQTQKERHPASAAVIALREALGLTQQRFAVEVMGCALNTVARWETTNPPHGETLVRLKTVAHEKMQPAIETTFTSLYLDETLGQFQGVLLPGPNKDEGWLVVKLSGRRQVDSAIEFFDANWGLGRRK